MDQQNKFPIIGKIYDCYDNGVIAEHRKYQVLITDIISFDSAPPNILKAWRKS